jgi:asparagine synthase (glutamine-hydrolysing)
LKRGFGREGSAPPLGAITFNGEIYNHAEARAELETLGCNFVTRSDTEVLIDWWTGITMFPADHVQRALDGFIASMDHSDDGRAQHLPR